MSENWLLLAREARERMRPYLKPTPLTRAKKLSEKLGLDIWLKQEMAQPTQAFKVRCAFNGMLIHLEEAKKRGVVTTSSGNFAQAVAYAGRELGVRTTIVMTDDTAEIKVRKTRELGGEVIFCGLTFESRFEVMNQVARERGSVVLHGFESVETIAGNGTLGLELLEQLSEKAFTALVPSSGGGLVSGVATVLSAARPECEVYSVQPEMGGALAKSLAAGKRVNIGKVNTIADALVASMPGERTFALAQKFVRGAKLVTEDEIRSAQEFLSREEGLRVEPGGCVGIAALLAGRISPKKDRPVVCVLSGGNF